MEVSREEKQLQLVKDYKNVFGSPEGQRVLADLSSRTTFNKTNVGVEKPIETNRLIYDEAQRIVILYIIRMIETDASSPRPTEAIRKETQNG